MQFNDFSGKAVLITGGTRGIGLACGLAFARHGARVILTHRWGSADEDALRARFAALGAPEPMIVEADVSRDEDTQNLLARIKAEHATIDVFVSNVAVVQRGEGTLELQRRSLYKSLEYSSWPFVGYLHAIHRVFGRYPRYALAMSSDGPDHHYPAYDYVAVAKAVDVTWAAEIFYYYAGWATKIEGRTVPVSVPWAPGGKFHAFTLREPVGVCAQITPWNFPLVMAAFKVAPALACGNTVILKPAEQTPLTAVLLAEVIAEAGVPAGVFNLLTGFGDVGAALSAHDGVDKVAFTGSTEVGKKIVNAASGNLKKVSLELGGKSPQVVFADADLEAAIPGVASGFLFNHGQTCTAGTRLLVEDAIFAEFTQGVAEHAAGLRIGRGDGAGAAAGAPGGRAGHAAHRRPAPARSRRAGSRAPCPGRRPSRSGSPARRSRRA